MTLQEAANVATIIAAALATPPIVWGVISHILSLQREKRKLTLEFWEEINQEIKNEKREIRKEFGEKVTRDQAEAILVDENMRVKVHKVLNQYERLATGANLGIYDITTLDRLTGTNLLGNYARFQEYIQLRRTQMNRPRAWNEFERLCRRLTRHRTHQAGKIFRSRS